MKNIYDENKRKKLSITISEELVKEIDDKTSNRSSLINWILKEYFASIGEDTTKIKL